MDAAAAFRQARGILSDLDGTLIDSSAPGRRAWSAFAIRHGLDPDSVHRFAQGRPSRETVRLLAPPAAHPAETQLLEDTEVHDTEGVVALAGAAAILALDRPLAIVTSCSAPLARARLAAAGLPVPAQMVCSYDVSAGKPDPECFLLGASRLGLVPADCVALEDAPAGISAARAAGVPVIALATTHSIEELGEADWIVADLSALLGEDG